MSFVQCECNANMMQLQCFIRKMDKAITTFAQLLQIYIRNSCCWLFGPFNACIEQSSHCSQSQCKWAILSEVKRMRTSKPAYSKPVFIFALDLNENWLSHILNSNASIWYAVVHCCYYCQHYVVQISIGIHYGGTTFE